MTLATTRIVSFGCLAMIIACCAALSANAQDFGDPALGHEFAIRHCSQCHAIGAAKTADTHSPSPGAPSFASVAKTSGMTGRALAAWLDTSHPTMPNLVLSKDDRDDVIAYIMSLK